MNQSPTNWCDVLYGGVSPCWPTRRDTKFIMNSIMNNSKNSLLHNLKSDHGNEVIMRCNVFVMITENYGP
jgi:hypothetical protein